MNRTCGLQCIFIWFYDGFMLIHVGRLLDGWMDVTFAHM